MPLVHTLGKPKRKSRYQSPWAFWSAVILVYIDIQGFLQLWTIQILFSFSVAFWYTLMAQLKARTYETLGRWTAIFPEKAGFQLQCACIENTELKISYCLIIGGLKRERYLRPTTIKETSYVRLLLFFFSQQIE